jgi:hypothetical protein
LKKHFEVIGWLVAARKLGVVGCLHIYINIPRYGGIELWIRDKKGISRPLRALTDRGGLREGGSAVMCLKT